MSKSLQESWFGANKTAVDIRRTLGKVLYPLSSYVKRYPAFLKDFNDFIEEYVEELIQSDLESDVIDTRGSVETVAEYGAQLDVDDFEEDIYADVPDEVTVRYTVEVDARDLTKDLVSKFRSDITDMREFKRGFIDILNNGKAGRLIGKILADRFQYYVKNEVQEDEATMDVIQDEVGSEIYGADLTGHPTMISPKVLKSVSRQGGRGFQILIEVSYGMEIEDDILEANNDAAEAAAEAAWEAKQDYWDSRYAMSKNIATLQRDLQASWFGIKTSADRRTLEKILSPLNSLVKDFGKLVMAFDSYIANELGSNLRRYFNDKDSLNPGYTYSGIQEHEYSDDRGSTDVMFPEDITLEWYLAYGVRDVVAGFIKAHKSNIVNPRDFEAVLTKIVGDRKSGEMLGKMIAESAAPELMNGINKYKDLWYEAADEAAHEEIMGPFFLADKDQKAITLESPMKVEKIDIRSTGKELKLAVYVEYQLRVDEDRIEWDPSY